MKKIICLALCILMLFSTAVSAAEFVIDLNSDSFKASGSWISSGVKGFKDSNTMYSKEGKSAAVFGSPLKTAGNAKVEFYNISNSSDPALEIYITYNTDKTVKIMLDQVSTADGWVDLGIYNFDAKASEGVTVVRGRGNTRINSVRFTETTDDVKISGDEATAPEVTEEKEAVAEENTEGALYVTVHDDTTTRTGEWKDSSLKGFGNTISINSTEHNATVTFKSPVKEGNAKVAFYNINDGSAPGAKLILTYDGDKTFEKELNQNEEKTGWVELGIFKFTGSENEGLQFVKAKKGGYARVSDARFIPTEEEPKVEEPETLPTDYFEGDDAKNIRMKGFTAEKGEWFVSQLRGFNESGSAYCGDTGCMAKWDPELDTPNMVTIYVYKLVYDNNVTDALYQVHHDGKVEDIRVNLKEGLSGWHCLGTFKFSGNGNEYVTLTKDNETAGEGYIRADAVKFIAVSDDEYINNNLKQYIIIDNDPPIYFMSSEFDDTKEHWAKENISLMAIRGLVKGTGENIFNPNGSITRAEFTTLITRILELEQTDELTYADSDGWFKGYIAAAEKAGLYNGFPIENNEIKPNQPISREEMALMIKNAGTLKGKPVIPAETKKTVSEFSDGESVSKWALGAAQYVVDNGIITGYEDGSFRPLNTATRAEATVMLQRFLEQVLWAGPVDTSKNWTLTFSDEFNGTELDTEKWVSENKENLWSALLSSRYPENLEVKDGCLYMHTKKNNPDPSNEWSTAYIWTKTFKQKCGYFEARYKYNAASGINNAFWLMTDGKTNGMNPGEHEIDINEGHYPNLSSHNLHFYDKVKETRSDIGYKVASTENYARDFHIFACEWTPEEIIFYVDGKEVKRDSIKDTAMEDTESLVRFSTAVAMNFAGKVTDECDGKAMIVDYVRVYQTDYK